MSELEENILEPTPVCIVSGFLGAGKTTFLNNLINGNHGLRIGVLVNDFGVINIDSHLVVSSDEDTVSLRNGCICCTVQDDFVEAVVKMVKRQDRPELLLVETSGVSDPNAVVNALTNPSFAPLLHVETVATLVDAYHFLAFSDDQHRVAAAQISAADLVVINKADTVDRARLAEIERCVGCKCGNTHDSGCDCDRHDHGHDDAGHHHTNRGGGHTPVYHPFQSVSYANTNLMSMERLREVLRNLPLSICRLKGLFHVDAAPDQRVLIQVVGERISVTQLGYWERRIPENEVVAIGKGGAVNDRMLAELLDRCLLDDALPLEQSLSDENFLRL
jgi:G3E family GTPase